MDVTINLDLESLLKLCDKDPEFQVSIQKAALNYLKNNRLKPLMKIEIVKEIEDFKKDIKVHVEKALKDLGINLKENWYTKNVSLSEEVKARIKEEVLILINFVISDVVKKELNPIYQKLKERIKEWETAIEYQCKNNITENTIKNIAIEVINNKFDKKEK